jgi:hypothetical protein
MSKNTLEPMHVFIAVASIIATMVFQFLTQDCTNPCHNYAKEYALLAVISLFLAMSLSIADYLKSRLKEFILSPGAVATALFDAFLVTSIFVVLATICREYTATIFIGLILIVVYCSLIIFLFRGIEDRGCRIKLSLSKVDIIFLVLPIIILILIGTNIFNICDTISCDIVVFYLIIYIVKIIIELIFEPPKVKKMPKIAS